MTKVLARRCWPLSSSKCHQLLHCYGQYLFNHTHTISSNSGHRATEVAVLRTGSRGRGASQLPWVDVPAPQVRRDVLTDVWRQPGEQFRPGRCRRGSRDFSFRRSRPLVGSPSPRQCRHSDECCSHVLLPSSFFLFCDGLLMTGPSVQSFSYLRNGLPRY